MQIENTSKPILICGKFRGLAQPIRYLLHYVDVQFDEIHLDKNGALIQKDKKLPQGFKFCTATMPYLVHDGLCVNQIFAIMSYICRRYNRQDLLGQNIIERARIHEIIQRYVKKKSQKFTILLALITKISQKPKCILQIKKLAFNCLVNKCEYIEPLLKYYQLTNSYVLGHFTVLDIFFYETSFYLVNTFGDLVDQFPIINKFLQFKTRFQKQDCYTKYKNDLESHKILFDGFDQQTSNIFKEIWLGDKNFFR